MKKTLLLCFIHGFKGGDDTFGEFPVQLQELVASALPKIDVRAIVYPKFETRGDLGECVSRFRDWLQEKVIDIEVTSQTPSPTIDPSVHVILVGHSMGGIVAADTILSLTSDQPIDSTPSASTPLNTLMFPYISGVLAFDTPYLGISPGVVAHGAEGHYNTASSALTQLGGITGALWGTKAATTNLETETTKKEPPKALSTPPTSPAVTSPWAKWGKIALAAGGVAAVTGAGAAVFANRDKITEGWGWVGSHLEFVGCLMKGEELKKRVNGLVTLNKQMDIGWANLYTRLGNQAVSKETGSMVGSVIGNQRTFCNLPKSEAKIFWREAINDKAQDEAGAHMTMFFPKDNPGFDDLTQRARDLIVRWTRGEWYDSSIEDPKSIKEVEEEMDLG
ncbi:hypothetical protein BJ875DRAFT_438167 [Amylocarpus encephaloides]|uniref:DUF676 domain-containing protein n=1 Tax=Amylocarpus encephaloides TaxID=45428 RepID=A0A9P7YQ74_9HELO|nr:hypothetical protein BJ875DRAFT_438167 [Amylocarpus encephaloides]